MRLCHGLVGYVCVLGAVGLLAQRTLGQNRELTQPPGLVELDAGAFTGDVNVTWDAIQPLTLSFSAYWLQDNRRVCVFIGVEGTYVLISDIIDWDNRTRTKTKWIVTITDGPPGPDPGPPPSPDRPDGLAGDIFDIAIKVNRPEQAKSLADIFHTVRSMLAARADMKPHEAQNELNSRLKQLTLNVGWREFETKLTDYLNQHGKTREQVIKILGEVGRGLRASVSLPPLSKAFRPPASDNLAEIWK